MDDEQALLAIVRYNRLIDIFLGLTRELQDPRVLWPEVYRWPPA